MSKDAFHRMVPDTREGDSNTLLYEHSEYSGKSENASRYPQICRTPEQAICLDTYASLG